jgi:KipI family sensor histidine kinase inhibitor
VSPAAIRRPIPTLLRDVRDGVVLLDLPEASDEEANQACVALAARLRGRKTPGLRDAVPGARSLLIAFDPLRLSAATLRDLVGGALAAEPDAHARAEARTLVVPVVYDGPDLEELARAAGISSAELARRHAGGEYRVAFLGFAPGFAYLTGLAPELHAPRLRVPRTRVPAGSVAIGGPYTGVYPETSPGGWRLVGRSGLRLLDPGAEPPALLRAGDRVRFESVGAQNLPRPAPARTPPRDEAREPRGAPVLRVLSPGLAATVQGSPGEGLGSSGIPSGGAVDPLSLARANAVVGNAPGAAGLEMGLLGCQIEVLQDTVLAFGGEVEAEWNGRPAAPETALAVAAGDRLRIGRVRRGVWAYLAVRAGLEPLARFAPQPRLTAGDVLTGFEGSRAGSGSGAPPPHADAAIDAGADSAREIRLRVMPGPESDTFDESELARFLGSAWRVSTECDRRGLRLEGAPPLAHRAAPEIPPSGTVPGTIQVPGGGLPIVLGPDGPVTGGYPRIATVIGADLPLLGRAAPGVVLRWTPVTLEDALRARRSSSAGVS